MTSVVFSCLRCLALRETPWRRLDIPATGRAMCWACGGFVSVEVLGVVRRVFEAVPPAPPDELTEADLNRLIDDALNTEE